LGGLSHAEHQLDQHPPGVIIARIAALLKIAPEGAAISLAAALAAILLLLVGLHWLGVAMIVVAMALGAFFRDPDRTPPGRRGIVLSGADGRVTDIGEGAPNGLVGNFRRVSVFMSPLNVHVNRAPVSGEVATLKHTAGEFRAAFSDHASEHNERNLIVIEDPEARRHAMVQVAGYLARRIVCRLHMHDRIEAGQRVGLIMFGSRVDHFMPLEYRITVKVGDRVKSGETAIGELVQ
jgi:phosphatidylserine decarboxylase